jgi:signal transduction histidine kinase
VPGSNDAVVAADEERLRQIVLNLLSNALKFTPRGGHVVLAWDMDEHDVIITIQDDGIGIPADKLDTVFEPYVQLDASAVGERTGWGLGLAISRDLARAMGGDLTASSSPGQGALFTLRLPRNTRVASDLSDS